MADDIKIVIGVDTAPVDRAVRVMDNLESELRDVERAMKKGLITETQYNAEVKRITGSMDRLKTVAKGSARDFRSFEKTVYGSGKALRQKEIALQQAGYQFQDFIVQVQGGTNPLIAFSQQGSQLAGFFAGPWGASIGLGIAALGFLGTAILGAGGKMETLQEKVEGFADLTDSWHDSAKNATVETDALGRAFGDLAENIKLSLDKLADFEAKLVEQKFQDVAKTMRDTYVGGGAGDRRAALGSIFGLGLNLRGETAVEGTGTLGFGRQLLEGNQLGDLVSGFSAVSETSDPEERLGILTKMVSAAVDLANANGEISEQEKELIDTLRSQEETYKSIVATKTLGSEVSVADAEKDYQDLLARTRAGMKKLRDERAQEEKEALEYQAGLEKSLFAENLAYESAQNKTEAANKVILFKAQVQAEKELFAENLAYESAQEKQKVKDNLILAQAQAQAELNLFEQNAEYEREQNAIRQKELDELNDKVESLAERLSIPFAAALALIRQAKLEATVGLDAFGDPGSFKYSGPQTITPPKPTRIKSDPLGDLQKQLKLEREILGQSEEYVRVRQALGDTYDKVEPKVIARLENQIRLINEAKQAEEERKSLMQTVESSLESGFMSMIDGTKSVKDAFKDMARQIIADLYRVLVVKRMVSSVTSLFGFADGGVFSGGSQVKAFADGGVVGGPTFFPMSGGQTGLMGEAGPEAIMPLKRGADGKLGVQAEGSSSGEVNIVQNFSFAANGDDSVKKLIAQAAPQIANLTQKQIMDSRRRGGTMKSTFG